MHECGNWSAAALHIMPVDWFIFAWVYLLWRQRKGKGQKYHIQMLVHWLIVSGVSYYDNRERAVMFDYDTNEKKHQNTRQSDLYSGATPPSYKSDSLVCRCSFISDISHPLFTSVWYIKYITISVLRQLKVKVSV
jgi:hypothetical protein